MRRETSGKRGQRAARWTGALLLAIGLGCTGGGETVVSGIANTGNRIGALSPWDDLAETFAALEVTPAVNDADIEGIYAAIRKRALEGEPAAALVLLQLAVEQREQE